jgi:hypothetical protein
MAGRARAATAAKRQQFVHPAIADDFHDGRAGLRIQFLFRSFTGDDDKFAHY